MFLTTAYFLLLNLFIHLYCLFQTWSKVPCNQRCNLIQLKLKPEWVSISSSWSWCRWFLSLLLWLFCSLAGCCCCCHLHHNSYYVWHWNMFGPTGNEIAKQRQWTKKNKETEKPAGCHSGEWDIDISARAREGEKTADWFLFLLLVLKASCWSLMHLFLLNVV